MFGFYDEFIRDAFTVHLVAVRRRVIQRRIDVVRSALPVATDQPRVAGGNPAIVQSRVLVAWTEIDHIFYDRLIVVNVIVIYRFTDIFKHALSAGSYLPEGVYNFIDLQNRPLDDHKLLSNYTFQCYDFARCAVSHRDAGQVQQALSQLGQFSNRYL